MSIKKRFLVSVLTNLFRAGLSLLTGLIIARGLGPSEYGNLAYLLSSFWAFRALLDMGASSAFFTFISRINDSIAYYLIYFGWLLFQFLFLLVLVFLLMPNYIQEKLWVNQSSYLIFLALVASYAQNQVWQTIVYIYESQRKTIQVQVASVLIISFHLFLMIIFWVNDLISVSNVLLALIFEYIVATLWLVFLMGSKHFSQNKSKLDVNLSPYLIEYIKYCKPMIVIGAATFLFEFADKWLLQNYSGAAQQGFFQVASQLSTIGLIAATSIMNILWKEISVNHGGDTEGQIILLHKKMANFLLLLVTSISCFFVPWSKDLISIMLGSEYLDSWPVLFVMLFYPIHQVMGQLNYTVLMGTGNTGLHMKLTIFGLVISFPVTFFLVGPSIGSWGFGLGMGALGFAIKTVVLNFFLVNLQTWFIYRQRKSKYKWLSQFRGLVFCLSLSVLIFWLTSELNVLIVNWLGLSIYLTTFVGISFAALVYFGVLIASILFTPKLLGIYESERNELITILRKTGSFFKTKV